MFVKTVQQSLFITFFAINFYWWSEITFIISSSTCGQLPGWWSILLSPG